MSKDVEYLQHIEQLHFIAQAALFRQQQVARIAARKHDTALWNYEHTKHKEIAQ